MVLGPIVRLIGHLGGAPDLGDAGDTLATIAAEFKSGATGSLSISTAALYGSGHRIEIYGEAGTLILANGTKDPVVGFQLFYGARNGVELESIAREEPDQRQANEDNRVAPVSRIAQRFLDAVLGGPPAHPSFSAGVRVQALIEAVRRSNKQRTWVDTTPN